MVERFEALREIDSFCKAFDPVSFQGQERDVTQFRKDLMTIK